MELVLQACREGWEAHRCRGLEVSDQFVDSTDDYRAQLRLQANPELAQPDAFTAEESSDDSREKARGIMPPLTQNPDAPTPEAIKKVADLSPDPNVARQQFAVADFFARTVGIPVADAYQNAEKIASEWWGSTKVNVSEAAKRIGNSVKDIGINNELNSIYARVMSAGGQMTDSQRKKVDELQAKRPSPEESMSALPAGAMKMLYDLGYQAVEAGGEVAGYVAAFVSGEMLSRTLGLRTLTDIQPWAEQRAADLMGCYMGATYRGFIEAGMDNTVATAAAGSLGVFQAVLIGLPVSKLPGISKLGQDALMKAATKVILKGGYQSAAILAAKRVAGMAAEQIAFGVGAAATNVLVREFAIEINNAVDEKQIDHATAAQIFMELGIGGLRGAAFAALGVAGAIKEGGAIYNASQVKAAQIAGVMKRMTEEAQSMRPGGKLIEGKVGPAPEPGAVAVVPKPSVSRGTLVPEQTLQLPPEVIPLAQQAMIPKPVAPPKPVPPPPTPAQMALVNPPRALEEPGPRVETVTELVSKPSAATSEPGKMHVDPDFSLPVHEAGEQPIADLVHDANLENFKEGADAKGIVKRLPGPYNRSTTGPILVFEKLNGERVIASGRHRLENALRNGEPSLPTQVIREKDGWTIHQASLMDAMANIRDGKGSIRDFAHFFKGFKLTPEEAATRGLLGDVGQKQGYAIGTFASDDLYIAFRNGSLSSDKVAAIANGAPHDAEVQAAAQRAAKGMKADELENYAAGLAYMKKQGLTGGDETQPELFKVSRKLESELKLEARTAAAKTGAMERELLDLKRARKMGEAERANFLKQYGFEAGDRDAMLTRVTELETELQRWDHWEQDPILHNQIREEAGLPPMQFRPAEELIEPAAVGEPPQPELMGSAPEPEQPPEPPREIQAPLPGMEALVSLEDQIRAATPPEAFQPPAAPPEKTSVLDFFKLDPKDEFDAKMIALQEKMKSQSAEPLVEARDIADQLSDDNSLHFPVDRIQRVREIAKKTAPELTLRDDKDLADAIGTVRQTIANSRTLEIDGLSYPLEEGRTEISLQLRKGKKPPSNIIEKPGTVAGAVKAIKTTAKNYLDLNRKVFLDAADMDINGERGSFFMTTFGHLLREGEPRAIELQEKWSSIPKNFLKENGIHEKAWVGSTRTFTVAVGGQDTNITLRRGAIIALYLHMQATPNQESLLTGFTLPFSDRPFEPIVLATADIQMILDSMSELEIKAAENAREMMDVAFPDVAAVYERIYGRPMGDPENYWPIHRTEEGKAVDWQDASNAMIANSLAKGAGVEVSHTLTRKDSDAPIVLRDVYADLNDYIMFASNFAAKAEDVIAAKKILWDSKIETVISARFGKNRLDNLKRALQISAGMKFTMAAPEALAENIRRAAVVNTIGAYAPTVLRSAFDSYRSIPYNGIVSWADGVIANHARRGYWNRFLNENCPEWREAIRSGASRERVDVLAGGQTKVGGNTKPIARAAMWAQQKVGIGGIRAILVGSIKDFMREVSKPTPNLTDDMITFTGLKISDLEKMNADEKEAAAVRYGVAVWQHTTASGLPETQSSMYHSGFLGRSWSTFSSDTNAIYNMVQERFANAKRLKTRKAWTALGTSVLVAFVVGPLMNHYIDELRRKFMGQKSQSPVTDAIGSIASLVYGGGMIVQGVLQSLRFGPAATTTGGLVQGTEADVVETAGYLRNALVAKNKKKANEAWMKFLIGATDLTIGRGTGLPINNFYRQGKAVERIMKDF
jgi:hypothetical protein